MNFFNLFAPIITILSQLYYVMVIQLEKASWTLFTLNVIKFKFPESVLLAVLD